MRVLIADDELLARELLATLLAELPDVELVGQAEDGLEAVVLARKLRPDLVFLDIDMPQRSGVAAAQELAGACGEVIFVTAHEEHAIAAFEVGALDYVLKPVRRPRLALTMERFRRRHEARDRVGIAPSSPEPAGADGLWVPVRGGTVRLSFTDVVRVEAARDHVYFHTAERAYLHRITMGELDALLAGTGLMRVHRSAFIRPERVTATARRGKALTLTLDDGGTVPVGSTYRPAVLAALAGTVG